MSFIGNLRVRTIVAIVALFAGAAFWWIFGSKLSIRTLKTPVMRCNTVDGGWEYYENVVNFNYDEETWTFVVRDNDGKLTTRTTNATCTITDRRTND